MSRERGSGMQISRRNFDAEYPEKVVSNYRLALFYRAKTRRLYEEVTGITHGRSGITLERRSGIARVTGEGTQNLLVVRN